MRTELLAKHSLGIIAFLALSLTFNLNAGMTPDAYCKSLPATSCEILNVETSDSFGAPQTFNNTLEAACRAMDGGTFPCINYDPSNPMYYHAPLQVTRVVSYNVKYCRNRKFSVGTYKHTRNAEKITCRLDGSSSPATCQFRAIAQQDSASVGFEANTACGSLP